VDLEDINQACYCHNTTACGPRCDTHQECPGDYLCDTQTSACTLFSCQEDADCPAGAVCGMGDQGRICRIPGGTADGEQCSDHWECMSGACLQNTCTSMCAFTADCAAGEVCGGDGLDPWYVEQGARICWTPAGLMCTPDEFEIENMCTDGTQCEIWDDCAFPTQCWMMPGMSFCVCDDPSCNTSCSIDADCGDSRLVCKDGLCRGLEACESDADCQAPRVCGFVDGAEQMGLRCVEPGAGADGTGCVNHSECASGFCADAVCTRRCDVTSDCEAGDECQATHVGPVVVGACKTASCGCATDQVCNLMGECGPGPLCNSDDDCDAGHACAYYLCRPTCQQTDQCQAGEDCTGISPQQPHVCLPATCGCAGNQVCDGGSCFDARPCDFDSDCTGGRCVGGQCYDDCTSTAGCPAGLECVTVWLTDWESYRLCTVPVCNCQLADSWCRVDQAENNYCFQGDDCTSCPFGDPDYNCEWAGDVYNVGDACRCINLTVCGPSCSQHEDCPHGYVCNVDSACELTTCVTDADCPAGTVCGAHPDLGYTARACWVPGNTADGFSCENHWECASAACVWSTCTNLCGETSECQAGEVCSYQVPGNPWNIAVCTEEGTSSCTAGCPASEWCHNSTCWAGQACFMDFNICQDPEVCDGTICGLSCVASTDCPAEQECVLNWEWDPVAATKTCREPVCNCRVRDDVCMTDGGSMRMCFWAQDHCSVMNPCPSGDYFCDDGYNWACRCTNDAVCGPSCVDSLDCTQGEACDPMDQSCKYMECIRDSDCPASSVCVYNGDQRFCTWTGTTPDGDPCDNWWECENGMCIQLFCADPCADNDECAADTCGAITGAGSPNNYPFCFAWGQCGVVDCSATQFCDVHTTCVDGPACTRNTDCVSGNCMSWDNKACGP
jgi:hypothetical protein